METSTLPPLREELALLPGPRLGDGQPTWTLHDPVRNLFFQIDWPCFEMLQRWSFAAPALVVEDIQSQTTLQVSVADVEALLLFLQQNQLLQIPPGSATQLAQSREQRKGGMSRWLLHNYLFFRIPLVKPDRWLTRWEPALGFLFGSLFLKLTVVAALVGLVNVYRSWEQFSSTLVDMLSWRGMLAYGATLIVIKVLHELGHGVTAKRYGCRVPTMGVAFLVLWPVAYTDTNEVWKLVRRDQRLKVAGAGISTELIIAAWATLAWAWLPEGVPKSVAFLLSSTTWVSTLLLNASPFMRFDGYFLLCDALQMPNLHGRSFALARWKLREWLFALGEPPPEYLSAVRTGWLVAFAWFTWIYRLIVFLGIAVLVYHFFIKAIGILLFIVEIVWFVALPIWNEIKAWRERAEAIRHSRRAWRSLVLAMFLLALFVLPWPGRVTTSGLLQPQEQFAIYAPEQAQLTALPFAEGARVDAGSVLMRLDSPQLQARQEQSGARRQQLSWQSAAAGFDAQTRKDWQVLDQQLGTALAERESINADAVRYAPVAPYNGILRDVDPDLQVGDWVSHRELLGRLVREGPRRVVTYIDDEEVQRISVGDRALLRLEGSAELVPLKVSSIDRDASRTLREPELAVEFGGHVLVREKGDMLYPERAVYRVLLEVTDEQAVDAQHSWRGQLTLAARWEAPGLRFLRTAASVFWREMGF